MINLDHTTIVWENNHISFFTPSVRAAGFPLFSLSLFRKIITSFPTGSNVLRYFCALLLCYHAVSSTRILTPSPLAAGIAVACIIHL